MAAVWHRLEIRCQPELADAVGARLLDLGAPGLETRQECGDVVVTAHFAAAPADEALGSFFDELGAFFPGSARPLCAHAQIADSDWAENWKQHFPPLALGERLFVHPPWVTDLPADRVAIVVDPGMAFGTGHHASTRGCLILLERLLRPGGRVLDIGTGSGILAIAAAKLGAGSVHATDIDPLAVETARANAAANRVGERIAVAAGTAPPGETFDLVLANLLAGDLIGLAAEVAALLRPGAVVVGSGLTADEADAVRAAWAAVGLQPRHAHSEDNWVTLAFAKSGGAAR